MLSVKVNGTSFGLVHKGSMHLAKSTAPDVCKTPSPGGPIPIPYPVIISLASDLANGTTTVKADGGNMIAVKDCEYARCSGDEAGSAGGVVSSTFMKEAKFILYSFDVKMDGKNACRLGDKMTMNHQNTFCMMGTTPTSVQAAKYEVDVDCQKLKSLDPAPPQPNGCATKELCAKIQKFNASKGKKKLKLSPSNDRSPLNNAYRAGKNRFANSFNRMVREHQAAGKPGKPPGSSKYFTHACRHEAWDGNEVSRQEMNPDHVKDAALGGSLKEKNLLWMHAEANQELGRNMGGYSPSEHPGGIKAPKDCNCG
ncbi:DUF4150 domain-containing protein [Paucibacter sp. R3-3]|uniref:DUF4150 domain-containing protein n=1 Tax=Roseateles agri TaxID=3098619 RepID=A0ABU5DAH8_9BURK|nr:DUF4150 domain-containing protein [Paucibacter sp. R3-3]MDY0743288.1 DUF4150 domain-containing protein [Paucibacter sp. R3-3]